MHILWASVQYRFDNVCYACLRAWKVDVTRDTELGMVRREDAERGMTHGLPLSGPNALPEYELIPHEAEPVDRMAVGVAPFPRNDSSHWYHVRVGKDALLELLRTPEFSTWQGARWLFCCRRPAVFIGEAPFEALAHELRGNRKLLRPRIGEMFGISDDDADDLLDDVLDGEHVHYTYAFRCTRCERLRAYEDHD
jgi:hypothetical protein